MPRPDAKTASAGTICPDVASQARASPDMPDNPQTTTSQFTADQPSPSSTSLDLVEADADRISHEALEVRKAARQFAMLYFHLAKTLVEEFGEDRARRPHPEDRL